MGSIDNLAPSSAASTEDRKRHGGCPHAQPGATQGGCCFDGARNTLLPISDVVHIVHGPIGCTGTSWDTRGSRSRGPSLFRIGMTTDLGDVEMITGRGEARLEDALAIAIQRYRPPAVFVYVTCVPAMLGADVEAVTRRASTRWNLPVITVPCAGFLGNKNLGQRIAGEVLLDHVIGTREPPPIPEGAQRPGICVHDVNLIGEWNVGGEFWNVAPFFDELGLRVLCTLSGDSHLHNVQRMHRAEVNMVVCSKALLRLARKLETKYGTPFFEGSFYGSAETSASLRTMARTIGDPDLVARTERLVAREERRVNEALLPLRDRLGGKRALIFSGGFKSWSTVSAVQSLGMTVVATGVEKSTEEDKARILSLMGPGARMLENNDQLAILRTFEECQAEVLIAGDRYIYPALKACVPFVDLDHVRDIGYAGYTGQIELARRIVAALEHPVWAQVRRRPPWLNATSSASSQAA